MSDRRDDTIWPLRPQAEPEILPPGMPDPRTGRDEPRIWVASHRIQFAKPGPLGLVLTLLGIGLVAGASLILLLGLFLLWVPIVGALVGGVLIAGLLRRRLPRARGPF